MNVNAKYNEYLQFINQKIDDFFFDLKKQNDSIIVDAMSYAVKDGGKRIRPVLFLATAEAFGLKKEDVYYFALAIEFIHSYSLVHDDLPAMDNDDFRRGKLSTHKKYGEAIGILAGDGLLNLAFEVALSKKNFNFFDAKALSIIAEFAGNKGMILGQALDLINEKNTCYNQKTLMDIYINKTSKLLTCPLLSASALVNDKYYDILSEYGTKLGLLFQIEDDILDEEGDLKTIGKTPHKDKDENKFSSIKIYGLEGAKNMVNKLYLECKDLISNISEFEFLSLFTDYIYKRKN